MSKRKEKRERVRQRWKLLESEINNLFESVMFEPFTEWKSLIEDEIINVVKKYNLLSWYGKEWEVITSLNPISNEYTFNIKTIKGGWRVWKITMDMSA